jgi:putative flippase GtrA
MAYPLPRKVPVGKAIQFIRYTVVGFASLGLFLILSYGLVLAGLPHGIAAGVAILTSAGANYWLHKIYTFQSARAVTESLPRYAALIMANSIFGSAFVALAVSWGGLGVLTANVLCAIAITAISFIVMKLKVM